jgi:hypothetical protein
MFGNLGQSFTAGFTQLTDIQEKLQKLKTDFEAGIETSLGINHEALGATSEDVVQHSRSNAGLCPVPLCVLVQI